ncbi:extracellular solute-binding protein [Paenibacillus sp. H1-7]|uniref:ABC transporter substrate-binding protein n=1 Tax=Paenibacillus sp. H1-7 TaxID=2282849 RepID=UPI001EF765A0|nr:extracellular solute-binding protein [Paenibacillus sp. H1-7]ULL18101.1 extracellular solute-binding protein [Paenibacillus sp. H1-7]
MNMRFLAAAAAVLMSLTAAAGCGKGDAPQATGPSTDLGNSALAPAKQEEPVKLLMAQKWSEINDADFKSLIVEPLQKRYPHIQIEMLKGENIKEMIAAGTVPDIVATWVNLIPDYQELGLVEDMTPLIKKHSVDLGRFQPTYLDTIRGYDKNGGLVALPYDANFNVIYYNKDIFDKFGVDYPKDGMTWDQTIELAKRVSREEQGIRYRGLETDGYGKLALQIALPSVKDGKSNLGDGQWKSILELAKTIEAIPYNEPVPNVHQRNQFMKDRNLAMFATGNNFNLLAGDAAKGLNWDIAQYPSYPDKPNQAGMVDEHVAFVSKTSKHKDEAFKVIEILTSDEIQKKLTRASGKLSVLKDNGIRRELGADMPVLQGKNLDAIFKGTYIPAYTATSKYPDAGKILSEQVTKYLKNEQDVNTTLRMADEGLQNHIRQIDGASGK